MASITGYQYRINGGSPVDVGNVLSALISGLSHTSYSLQVRALDDEGHVSDWSDIVIQSPLPDTTPPSVPAGLATNVISDTEIDLSWSASTGGPTGYRYRVNAGTAVDVGNVLNTPVTGLTALTSYDFQVQSYDGSGNHSAWSGVVSATTAADGDAAAFLTATGVSDPTTTAAINALVLSLKSAGLWTKCYAIYPYVGTTAATHKYNLKDPRDLDAAYRGTFNGSVTHNANGITGDGSTGYMDTHLNGSTVLSKTNMHWSLYSRSNSGNRFDSDFGAAGSSALLDLSSTFQSDIPTSSDRVTHANSVTDGFFMGSLGASDVRFFWLGNNFAAKGSAATSDFVNETLWFLGGSFGKSLKNHAFGSIGQYLTDAEALAMYQIVENFQFALSRNVYDPPSAPPQLRIDLGSNIQRGRWNAETLYVSGGSAYTPGTTGLELNAIIKPGRTQNTNVYGTARKSSVSGTITYTVTGLTPSTSYTFRVHAHDHGDGAGTYVQSVKVNGTTIISSYDVRTFGGAGSKIGIKEFTASSDGSGHAVIDIVADSGKIAIAHAIEVRAVVDYRKLVCAGDSITWGSTLANETLSWPSKIAEAVSGGGSCIDRTVATYIRAYDETYRWTVHKFAAGGQQFTDLTSQSPTYLVPYDDPLNTKQIVFAMSGPNDILSGGLTAAQAYSNAADFFATVPGGWIKGIGVPLPNTFTEPFATTMEDLRTLVRANSGGYDFVVDWVTHSSHFNNPADTTYYADGTHPTAVLAQEMADIMVPIIEGL
jgi:chitodextrinase/lysophospholipase L1-like esterase